RVIAPADAAAGHGLVLAAIRDGATVSAAVTGSTVVGLALAGPPDDQGRREILAVGVEPTFRRHGLGGSLLRACAGESACLAEVTLAERDPIGPLSRDVRATVARRLLAGAGFEIRPAEAEIRAADPGALRAMRPAAQAGSRRDRP
ncbi:MAG TPA: GNAT family N-acetyltransferase, partial [Candidatus Limnocylindrales bacterium]|nr:GNAT family N-acetyltransferase [Candidatus Limnocylindrales bacterium]